MRFKLDENFGSRTQSIFREAGHDVQTVWEQEILGSPDGYIFEICRSERRCLVTLDTDFADVTRFPPQRSSGIAVIRLHQNPSLTLLEQLIRQFLHALASESISARLWIVEVGRIRIHQPD